MFFSESSDIWRNGMSRFVISEYLFKRIERIVDATNTETGVRLIGRKNGEDYLINHIIEPGKGAKKEIYSYECDNDYAEETFNRLLDKDPSLRFLGELHVHPTGFPYLSEHDKQTIQEVLKEYPVFIAGVMLRNPFRMYPILFTQNKEMEVIYDFYEKPKTKETTGGQTRVRYWMWKYWFSYRRDASKDRNRTTNADRS